jgi:hypothetical protein
LTGYKQYKTNRKYMARMGDWRNNKDDEIQLDGIGGVNIMVKGDVHRSGTYHSQTAGKFSGLTRKKCRHQLPMLCVRESSRDRGLREDGQARGLWRVWTTKLCCLAHRYRGEAWKCLITLFHHISRKIILIFQRHLLRNKSMLFFAHKNGRRNREQRFWGC